MAYMREEVARVRGVPSDEPSFRALDLNLEISPVREKWSALRTISGPASLMRLSVEAPRMSGSTLAKRDPEPRRRRTSRQTGALRTWLAFGDTPSLRDRSKRDGADYPAMAPTWRIGASIRGATVPVKAFIADLLADLGGATVRSAYADAYRSAELRDYVAVAVGGREVWHRAGRLAQAVRAFQSGDPDGRAVATVKPQPCICNKRKSTLRRDGNGNPAIDRAQIGGTD